MNSDNRFEIAAPVNLGLVCFRLKVSVRLPGFSSYPSTHSESSFQGPNELTEKLLKRLNEDRRVYLVPTSLKGKFVLRLAIQPEPTKSEDIQSTWKVLTELADGILRDG